MSLCTLVAGAVTFAVVYCQSLPALVSLMFFQGLSLGESSRPKPSTPNPPD